jgi:hypothetical protein
MDISTFAEKHRLKTKVDECGESIIAGTYGQIYEYSTEELGVLFMPPPTHDDPCGRWCPKIWNKFKRDALAIGMTLRQNADSEGALSFSPTDKAQIRLAMKMTKLRAKRIISEEQKAKLVATLAAHRQKHCEEHAYSS